MRNRELLEQLGWSKELLDAAESVLDATEPRAVDNPAIVPSVVCGFVTPLHMNSSAGLEVRRLFASNTTLI
jgi:hypothetical protein